MGQGGYLNLINATPYTWAQSYQHSYQMDQWAWPQTIAPGSSQSVYVEWNLAHTTSDDGGEVTYNLVNNPNNASFQIQARASNGFTLQSWLSNIATYGHAKNSVVPLGWEHDGFKNWILSGTDGAFSSSAPPTGWMQTTYAKIKDRPLRHIAMPGSHDAGMSAINGKTAFAFPCNTLTQTQTIYGQLVSGARYFDIRPVVHAGEFYTGHYGNTDSVLGWQGANGQSIADIATDVNNYLAANNELVVLNLSHDLDTDTGYVSFSSDQWTRLLAQLNTSLRNLFIANSTTVDLTTLPLSAFLGTGPSRPAVIVVVEPSNAVLGALAGKGFYTYSQFNAFNLFSNTPDVNTMVTTQLQNLTRVRSSPDSQEYLLSWTLTQDAGQAATCETGVEPSILDLAAEARPALFQRLLGACSKATYPNILYVDALEGDDVAALAVAINDYMGS